MKFVVCFDLFYMEFHLTEGGTYPLLLTQPIFFYTVQTYTVVKYGHF